jgi:hypothetical protein
MASRIEDAELKAINEKLDRLLLLADRADVTLDKHGEQLASQEVTLQEHIRRTQILEAEVVRLDRWRVKWQAVSAFVTGLAALAIAAISALRWW